MSESVAHAAIMRMNMREVAVNPTYSGIGVDLAQLASVKGDDGHKAFLERRAEQCASFGVNEQNQRKPFAFGAGLAFIPVHGTLINRFGGSYSFITGYNFLRSQVAAAVADDDVMGIVLDVNSYGGEAAGCFECAAFIAEARKSKMILAVVDSNAYSAAYAIASAANKIVVTPSGGAGSIGVVGMHVDMSKLLTNIGYTVTLVHSGAHKVDGNPYEPLPDEVKAKWQAGMDKSRAAFASLVSTNLGIDLKKVMDTEAQTYRADEALAIGLIHAIASPEEAVRAFIDELSGSTPKAKGHQMSNETKTEPAPAVDARKAERARISGIQTCAEATGRESLANHLALNTEMSVDEAKAILGAAPKATTEAPKTDNFKAAMDASTHPGLNSNDGGGTQQESASASILRNHSLATGVKYN